jgi:hypothetical protein
MGGKRFVFTTCTQSLSRKNITSNKSKPKMKSPLWGKEGEGLKRIVDPTHFGQRIIAANCQLLVVRQLWFELRNLLLANERRQRITPAQTVALNLVQELPLRLDGQGDSDTTLQLTRAHRLTIYDAAYLEPAVRCHLPLVTFDTALAVL